MISLLRNWLTIRRQAREAAGYKAGASRIEQRGVDAVESDFEADYAVGGGHSAFDAGMLRAIQDARAGQLTKPQQAASAQASSATEAARFS